MSHFNSEKVNEIEHELESQVLAMHDMVLNDGKAVSFINFGGTLHHFNVPLVGSKKIKVGIDYLQLPKVGI